MWTWLVDDLVTVREDEGKDPDVERCEVVRAVRPHAERYGFERVGVLIEDLAGASGPTPIAVWTDGAGTELRANELFYSFQTHFEDGSCLLTWGLHDPTTRSRGRLRVQATTGSFAGDLASHRAVVRYRSARPRVHVDLADHAASSRRYYRELCSVSDLLGPLVRSVPIVTIWASLLVWFLPFVTVSPEGWIGLTFSLVAFLGIAIAIYLESWGSRRDLAQRAEAEGYTSAAHMIRAETLAILAAAPHPPARTVPVPAASRCPYCHDTVALAATVCGTCRAAHHPECWSEHARCASCAHAQPRRRAA